MGKMERYNSSFDFTKQGINWTIKKRGGEEMKNKIDSLKIKLDRKIKSKTKGIIVKYKNVKSVGHIVIVD